MKVSIITVSYNADKTIRDTIESVISQSYPDIEYIVVDGASTDLTVDIIKQYDEKGISKWVSEKDQGIYDGMNKGIGLASGDIIGILNADDLYASNKVIEEIVDLCNSSGSDAVYADLEYVHEVNLDVVKRRWKSGPYERDNFLTGWMPPHPTFFLKAEFYKQFGNYLTNMKSAADYELMLRMLFKNKLSAVYLPKTIIKMRMGGVSNSSIANRLEANRDDRKAWELNGLKPKWYTLYLKPISKLSQFLVK